MEKNWSTRYNRPIRRYAIRTMLEILCGRGWAHKQDWWPGVVLDLPRAGSGGHLWYKQEPVCEILPWAALSRQLSEVTVVGSGPSTREQIFSTLPPETAILLNGAIHLLDGRVSCPPLAVVVEDERFVWRHFASMRKLIAPQTACLFSTSALRAICEIEPSWLATQQIFHIDFLQKPYNQPRRPQAELERLDFLNWSPSKDGAISRTPDQGVFAGGSVAVTAIQLALYLRPFKIGLAGIDLSNANEPRFYEEAGNTANSGISHAQDRILAAVAAAQSECINLGIALVNYSPVSALATLGIPYEERLSGASQ